ncbi:MAG: sigma-70 family RNA polymerase sigma factor [Burkholderiales bacterium]|nr:sigma-70 family RNA polymerase sigma factor [Burkholderiales bacterium]
MTQDQNPGQPERRRSVAEAHRPARAGGTGIDALGLERHRPRLVKFAMRRLRDAAQAEDLVQETLLAALQAAGRFRGDAEVGTWLTGILKHKILEHFRRQRRHVPLDELDPEDVEARYAEHGAAAGPALPADRGDPETALSQGRFFHALEGCMSRLPPRAARAFHMREVLGMKTDEIGAELGITASNSGVLLHRARASLRTCLRSKTFGDVGCCA